MTENLILCEVCGKNITHKPVLFNPFTAGVCCSYECLSKSFKELNSETN